MTSPAAWITCENIPPFIFPPPHLYVQYMYVEEGRGLASTNICVSGYIGCIALTQPAEAIDDQPGHLVVQVWFKDVWLHTVHVYYADTHYLLWFLALLSSML